MLATTARRAVQQSATPKIAIHNNPYTAKRPWPPDLTKLSKKHQFRLERKYKRRTKDKYLRPRWMLATKLAQWGICGFAVVYGVFFMDWKDDGQAFKGARDWYRNAISSIWTVPSPSPPPRHQVSAAAQSPQPND